MVSSFKKLDFLLSTRGGELRLVRTVFRIELRHQTKERTAVALKPKFPQNFEQIQIFSTTHKHTLISNKGNLFYFESESPRIAAAFTLGKLMQA
jgi:hypothetical protein